MPTSARSHGLRVAPIALMMMLAACSQEKAPKKGPVEVGVVTLAARNVTVDSELPIQGLRLDLDTDWIPQSPLPDGVSFSPGSVYIAAAGTELSITMNMPSMDR